MSDTSETPKEGQESLSPAAEREEANLVQRAAEDQSPSGPEKSPTAVAPLSDALLFRQQVAEPKSQDIVGSVPPAMAPEEVVPARPGEQEAQASFDHRLPEASAPSGDTSQEESSPAALTTPEAGVRSADLASIEPEPPSTGSEVGRSGLTDHLPIREPTAERDSRLLLDSVGKMVEKVIVRADIQDRIKDVIARKKADAGFLHKLDALYQARREGSLHRQPVLLAFGGPSAIGKSALAERTAQDLHWTCIERDAARQAPDGWISPEDPSQPDTNPSDSYDLMFEALIGCCLDLDPLYIGGVVIDSNLHEQTYTHLQQIAEVFDMTLVVVSVALSQQREQAINLLGRLESITDVEEKMAALLNYVKVLKNVPSTEDFITGSVLRLDTSSMFASAAELDPDQKAHLVQALDKSKGLDSDQKAHLVQVLNGRGSVSYEEAKALIGIFDDISIYSLDAEEVTQLIQVLIEHTTPNVEQEVQLMQTLITSKDLSPEQEVQLAKHLLEYQSVGYEGAKKLVPSIFGADVDTIRQAHLTEVLIEHTVLTKAARSTLFLNLVKEIKGPDFPWSGSDVWTYTWGSIMDPVKKRLVNQATYELREAITSQLERMEPNSTRSLVDDLKQTGWRDPVTWELRSQALKDLIPTLSNNGRDIILRPWTEPYKFG